ncbi:MAG: glycosyltransferase [Carbonactinosporaceae bacterium]
MTACAPRLSRSGPRRATRPPGRVRVLQIVAARESLRLLTGQSRYLRRQGIDYAVVSSPGPQLDSFVRTELVPTHAVPMARAIDPLGDAAALFRLVRIINRLRPHVLHGHTSKGGMLAVAAGHITGVPSVFHLGGLASATGTSRTLLGAAERASIRLADRVLAVSPSLLGLARDQGLCPHDIGEVPGHGSLNGVEADSRFNPNRCAPEVAALRERLGIPDGAPVIGFVGRLARDTGGAELVAAWSALRRAVPGVRLLLVGHQDAGDCPPAGDVATLADPHVHLTGWVEDPAAYYSLMSVLALPSARERLPAVALEANAMRVPVVATRVPGIVDAVEDGSTGSLVAPGDHAGFARALRAYLTDHERAREHGIAGRRRTLGRFRPSDVWDTLAGVYQEMAGLPDSQ